jgi:hypothetical protein
MEWCVGYFIAEDVDGAKTSCMNGVRSGLVAHRGFEPLISSLRGTRPRPLDECATKKMAGDPGFEPGQADPESAVLPLDESPACAKG